MIHDQEGIQHLGQRLDLLQREYELLSEKILRLSQAYVVETGAAARFQLEIQIRQAEAARDQVAQQLEVLEERLPFTRVLSNPYTFGVPVRGEDRFFGREKELQTILGTLMNVPYGQKQDIVVLGPRRIGKSSLLYRLDDLLTSNPGFVPVYIDVQNIKPRKTRILFFEILQSVKEGYEQQAATAEVPQFKALESDGILEDLEFYTFKKDIAHLDEFIAFHNLPRLVLMFDEVELLLEFGGLDTLDWFRGLIQSMLHLIFVVAGSERLYSLTQDYGSPFYNIFKTVELHPLTRNAARKLVEVPAAEIGMKIARAEVDKILHYAGNNPYFIQGICHYLVELVDQKRRREVYPEDVEEVIKRSVEYLSAQFAYVWGGMSQIQRAILYALARRGQPQDADALVSSLPYLRELVQSERKQQDIFDDLVKQQVLKVDDGNRYWLVVVLFADWIIAKVDDEEVIRLAEEQAKPITLRFISKIRSFMVFNFDDVGLDAFALDHFPEVYDRYSRGMRKDEKINIMLDYIRRHPESYDKLINFLAESSPEKYEAFREDLHL